MHEATGNSQTLRQNKPQQSSHLLAEIPTTKVLSSVAEKLNPLIKIFNQTYQECTEYPGLSNSQTERFFKIQEELKAYHEKSLTKETSPATYQRIRALEEEMQQLNRIRHWWNIELKVLDPKDPKAIWNSPKYNHTLNEIKKRWAAGFMFAAFSNEDLIMFYRDFINPLEKHINECKHSELASLAKEVQSIKDSALSSMRDRLESAFDAGSIECDDIIYHLSKQIETAADIKIINEDATHPLRRMTLTCTQFKEFIEIIQKNDENDPLLNKFKHPDVWESWANTDRSAIDRQPYHLTLNPIFVFAQNHWTFPSSKETHEQLADAICEFDFMQDANPLQQANSLLKNTAEEYDAVIRTKECKGYYQDKQNPVKMFIDSRKSNFDKFLKTTNEKFISLLNAKYEILIKGFFEKEQNEIFFTNTLSYLNRYQRFKNQFPISEKPAFQTDPMLIVIDLLLKIINENTSMSDVLRYNIKNFLLLNYPHLPSKYALDFEILLDELPGIIKIFKENSKELADSAKGRYLLHHLEKPLQSVESLSDQLERHQLLAKKYAQHWHNKTKWDHQDTRHLATDADIAETYSNNIVTPFLTNSPTITLDNFNQYTSDFGKETNWWIEAQKTLLARFQKTDIEDYLSHKENVIHSENITLLLKRAKQFFSLTLINQFITKVKDTTRKICVNHIKDCLKENKPLNFSSVEKISQDLTIDIFSEFSNQVEIAAGVSKANGSEQFYIELFLKIIPDPNNMDLKFRDLIVHFARKRLHYIQSQKEASHDDAAFFKKFECIPDVATAFKNTIKGPVTLTEDTIGNFFPCNSQTINQFYYLQLLCCDRELLQNHYATFFKEHLEKKEYFGDSGIAKYLATKKEFTKNDAENLFGKNNIPSIIAIIDEKYAPHLNNISLETVTAKDCDDLLEEIQLVKPIESLYKAMQKNNPLFDQIKTIENNLTLQKELKQISALSDFTHKMDLLCILAKDDTLLNPATLPTFIKFLNEHILNQKKKNIENQKIETLQKFLACFTGDAFREMLFHAFREEAIDNPFWFTLINDFGDENRLDEIPKHLKSEEKYSSAFKETYQASLSLINMARMVEKMIQQRDGLIQSKQEEATMNTSAPLNESASSREAESMPNSASTSTYSSIRADEPDAPTASEILNKKPLGLLKPKSKKSQDPIFNLLAMKEEERTQHIQLLDEKHILEDFKKCVKALKEALKEPEKNTKDLEILTQLIAEDIFKRAMDGKNKKLIKKFNERLPKQENNRSITTSTHTFFAQENLPEKSKLTELKVRLMLLIDENKNAGTALNPLKEILDKATEINTTIDSLKKLPIENKNIKTGVNELLKKMGAAPEKTPTSRFGFTRSTRG